MYCRMFSGIVLPATEKPQFKIPSKLKEALREAKSAVEKRLKDEQKVVSVCKKLDRVVTPHVCDVSSVIVLTSCVCLSVCYHSHSQTDRRTDLNFGMEVKWKDI